MNYFFGIAFILILGFLVSNFLKKTEKPISLELPIFSLNKTRLDFL